MTLPAVDDQFVVRPATMNDAQAVTDLLNANARLVNGTKVEVEGLRMRWGHPDLNLATDTLVVHDLDGRLVAVALLDSTDETPVHPSLALILHPDLDDATYQSLGMALLEWGTTLAKRVYERVPEGARVSVISGTNQKHERQRALLQSFGMTHIRNFNQMRIDFDAPPEEPVWPEGITIRSYHHPADLNAMVDTYTASWQDHFGFIATTSERARQEFRYMIENNPKFDASLWYLAFDGDTMAGICLCEKENPEDPDMGLVDILGVRREYRKRGLGLALLRHAFCQLYERGRKSVKLGVDASNLTGATRLYERAGMRVQRVQEIYELELRPGEELIRK